MNCKIKKIKKYPKMKLVKWEGKQRGKRVKMMVVYKLNISSSIENIWDMLSSDIQIYEEGKRDFLIGSGFRFRWCYYDGASIGVSLYFINNYLH